jgi:hypothetical protein
MTHQPPQPVVITDAQAALVEAAQLRIAAQRLKLAQQQAGKLRGTEA